MLIHVLKEKETLEDLSRIYKIPICMIIRANMEKAEEPLRPGRHVLIPPYGFCDYMAEEEDEVFHYIRYTVEEGDTVFSIARRYGTSMLRLLEKNELCRPEEIKPGLELLIPRPKEGYYIYTVKAGQELFDVEAEIGMDEAELIRLNKLAGDIYPGMQLIARVQH